MENKPFPSSYVIALCVLALAALGVYFLAPDSEKESMGASTSTPQISILENSEQYENATQGVAFDYPTGYVLDEKERGDARRAHYAIVLIRSEDSEPRVNSEGPTSVNIDLYQNNQGKQTLVGWLTGSNNSNVKLSDGTYTATTVDGREAIVYRWSGLYEGETTLFLHDDTVVAVTVTFITPEDENIATYKAILSSLRLSEKTEK